MLINFLIAIATPVSIDLLIYLGRKLIDKYVK